MAVNLSPIGGVAAQFFDNSGNPLTGGKIFTYTAGTTTPQTTYTSAGGATAHANPIILDAAGRVPGGEIWLTDGLQYKFLIKTSTDVQIGSYDNIVGINSNFVNYTSSQEIQTATAGQTVFTLTTMQYQPGTNSLSVFVDVVNQYGPGALYAYVETSSTVVTFTSGLHVGADVKFTTTAINSSAATDAEQVGYIPPYSNAVATNVEVKLSQYTSVFDFMTPTEINNVKNNAGDVTAAVQRAFDAMSSINIRNIYFPPGTYRISDTINAFPTLTAAQFVGGSGYDGVRGPINDGLRTNFLWIGSTDAAKPMVKFDRASGVLWHGISLNCNYKAGYGLQFMSNSLITGGVKNIVQDCSIHYALRDGIIIGQDGNPTANPGGRQFFGNVFRNLTMYGCYRSAIHVNEWNADQQLFDTVMVYLDDAPTPQNTLNAFWFDHGGQSSILLNCQSGGMTVVPGIPSSGFAIRNKADDASPYSTTGGAFGLSILNFWQEGDGGLYYGVTSTEDGKGFVFENCRSFTNNTANRSVYIDKGTSSQIQYTFIGCAFYSDIKIDSATFGKQSLSLINCWMASGRYLYDSNNNAVTLSGRYVLASAAGPVLTIPRFANIAEVTLTGNINSFYAEGVTAENDNLTVVIKQDVTGSRTINWTSTGNVTTLPTPPAPNIAAGSNSTYTFRSNGTAYYYTGGANT